MKTKLQSKYDLTHLAMVGPDGIPVFLIPSATPDQALNAQRKQERAKILLAINSREALIQRLKANTIGYHEKSTHDGRADLCGDTNCHDAWNIIAQAEGRS